MKTIYRAWHKDRKMDVLSIDFVNCEALCIGHDIEEGEDPISLPLASLDEGCILNLHGKEVKYYENDIVLVQGSKRVGLYKAIIKRTELGFVVFPNKSIVVDGSSLIAVKEVIGNIYQNQKLLIE